MFGILVIMLFKYFISILLYMGTVQHGVAGDPIGHSLSPVLFSIVYSHLTRIAGVKLPNLKGVAIIPTKGVENALAWGYAGELPSPPDWDYVGSPLGKFRANTLLERAVNASLSITEADKRLPNADLELGEFEKNHAYDDEVWLSLTSPLKHQLSAAAVRSVDNCMEIRSVNTLRWDGVSWSAASTDGLGLVLVAKAFDYPTDGVIGITGGGGTARSVAAAWSSSGGKVKQMGGKRLLDIDGPWDICYDEPNLVVDFDKGKGDIIPIYSQMEGDLDERIEHLSKSIDGRWLLCAQHLYSWANLWAPEFAEELPSLALLMTRLVSVEVALS